MRLSRWCVSSALVAVGSLAASLALAQEVAPQEQYHLRLEYTHWTPKLAADLQIGAPGGDAESGTLLDVKADLGLEDRKAKAWNGTLRLSRSIKLRGSATPIDYRGDLTARRTFVFSGTTYEAAARVVSSLKGRYYTGALELDFVQTRRGYLGLMVGAQVFDFDAALEAPARGIRAQSSKVVPIPVVGGAGRIYIGRISLSGELSGLSIGRRGHVYEISAGAGLHVSDRLALKGGYRRLNLKGQQNPDLVDLTMEGWHFGAEVSF